MSKKVSEDQALERVAEAFKMGFETAVVMLDEARQGFSNKYDGRHNKALKSLVEFLGNYINNLPAEDIKEVFQSKINEERLRRELLNESEEDKPLIYQSTNGVVGGGSGHTGGLLSF